MPKKPRQRWNGATLGSLCRLFLSKDVAKLCDQLTERDLQGELDLFVQVIIDPKVRCAGTRQRIEELRTELRAAPGDKPDGDKPDLATRPTKLAAEGAKRAPMSRTAASPAQPAAAQLSLPVLDVTIQGGLIANEPTGAVVDAPWG